MLQLDNYKTIHDPTWCPGCGNYAIWNSLKQALMEMNLAPHQVLLTFDIGCSGNMADKINTYAFKTLHGRTVAAAIGAKIANEKLPVVAIGGDGGIMEEGVNHLMWAARSNYDITVIMHENAVFGLTTGQPNTLTMQKQAFKIAPWGVVEKKINPIHLALVSNATFVARGFAGDPVQVKELIKQGMQHKGFSFIDLLQPCVTFNTVNTYEWFRKRVHKLENEKGYDTSNWDMAFKKSKDWEEKIATGVIYEDKASIPYHLNLPHRKDVQTTLVEEVKKYSIEEFIGEFE
jgi:2-oxoglutarate ferredoxin oxidoreductase subunit beta